MARFFADEKGGSKNPFYCATVLSQSKTHFTVAFDPKDEPVAPSLTPILRARLNKAVSKKHVYGMNFQVGDKVCVLNNSRRVAQTPNSGTVLAVSVEKEVDHDEESYRTMYLVRITQRLGLVGVPAVYLYRRFGGDDLVLKRDYRAIKSAALPHCKQSPEVRGNQVDNIQMGRRVADWKRCQGFVIIIDSFLLRWSMLCVCVCVCVLSVRA